MCVNQHPYRLMNRITYMPLQFPASPHFGTLQESCSSPYALLASATSVLFGCLPWHAGSLPQSPEPCDNL